MNAIDIPPGRFPPLDAYDEGNANLIPADASTGVASGPEAEPVTAGNRSNASGRQVQDMASVGGLGQRRARDLATSMVALREIKPVLRCNYLVKGWLDRGRLSVVYGESNVGKTFFALDVALHLAAGAEEWHGSRLAAPVGPVVYIAAEGMQSIHNRLAAIQQAHPDFQERAGENFILLPASMDLSTGKDGPALLDALKSSLPDDPSLIVVDTLARTMGDGDENTAKDMGAYVRTLDALREVTGAHVMVIHHSGKDTSKGARGSTSLRAAADTEIELTRSGPVIMAGTRKQRDMPVGRDFAYKLRVVVLGQDEDGDDVTSAVVEPTALVQKHPKPSGQQRIAMQVLVDALADHGEEKGGDMSPHRGRCVRLKIWRDRCVERPLSAGGSESANRQAFGRAQKALEENKLIRVVDGYVWKIDDEQRSDTRDKP